MDNHKKYLTAISTLPGQVFSLRAVTAGVLAVFSAVTFFGFTLYLDPQPARAFIEVPVPKPVIVIANPHKDIKDTIFAVAKAVALIMAVNFSTQLMQKLEQNHVIRNILFYSDALEADVYIGNKLNKITGVGPTTTESFVSNASLDEIIGQLSNTRFPGQTDEEIIGLALLNTGANFNAERPNGLTPAEEAMLTRVGVALLTSHAQCGGSRANNELVGKIALYNAARALSYNPSDLDPRSGVRFYQQLSNYGNPFANRYFQELNLRSIASDVEADARAAAQAELLAPGTKSLRSANFNITRTGQTITNFIQVTAQNAFDSAVESSDNAFVQSIVRVILNIFQGIVFAPGGIILSERSTCGVSPASSTTYDGGIDIPVIEKAFITANGKTTLTIKSGEEVVLNWSIGSHAQNPGSTDTAEVTGLGAVENSGTVTVNPTEDTIYELSVILDPTKLVNPGEGESGGSGGPGFVQGTNTDDIDESKRVTIASATVVMAEEVTDDGGSGTGGGGGGGGGETPDCNNLPNGCLGNDTPNPPNLNSNKAVWIDEDISNWDQTTNLDAGVSGSTVTLNYDKAGTWPAVDGSVANAWLCAYRTSQWYCGTWEWLTPNQTKKSTENLVVGSGVIGKLESEKELVNFVAQSGDHYYLIVSGLARNNQSNVQERSNFVRVIWP